MATRGPLPPTTGNGKERRNRICLRRHPQRTAARSNSTRPEDNQSFSQLRRIEVAKRQLATLPSEEARVIVSFLSSLPPPPESAMASRDKKEPVDKETQTASVFQSIVDSTPCDSNFTSGVCTQTNPTILCDATQTETEVQATNVPKAERGRPETMGGASQRSRRRTSPTSLNRDNRLQAQTVAAARTTGERPLHIAPQPGFLPLQQLSRSQEQTLDSPIQNAVSAPSTHFAMASDSSRRAGRPPSTDTATTRSAAGQNHRSRAVGTDLARSHRSWRKHLYTHECRTDHAGRDIPGVNRTVNTVEGGKFLVSTAG